MKKIMSRDSWIMLNKDVTEAIEYARFKLSDPPNNTRNIWDQIERINQNLQVLINDKINSMNEK